MAPYCAMRMLGPLLASAVLSGACARPTGLIDAEPEDAACPIFPADACPGPSPSYAREVMPILAAKCNTCHSGDGGPWPLTNHEEVVEWLPIILLELERCTMPPADSGVALTASEQKTLLAWLACGAPDD